MAFVLRKPVDLSPTSEAFLYQTDAIMAVRDMAYAAIFHEQGLGKTKMAIDVALYWLENDIVDTVFIVTKKALVNNWDREIRKHSSVSPRVLSDDKKANNYALNAPVLIYVLNYEVCLSNFELIERFQRTCRIGAILDESQKIKNPEAKLTQAFLDLSDGFIRKIIMTGTPIANRPYDIWSQISFLDKGESLGNDYETFKSDTDIANSVTGKGYGGVLEDIYNKTKAFSVRETKASSGIVLPEKTILTHLVDLAPEQRKMYDSYRDEMCLEFMKGTRVIVDDAEDILKRLLRLVQCASNPYLIDKSYSEIPSKLSKLLELLEETVTENKIIVWTNFVANAEWLKSKVFQWCPEVVHGEMHIDQRNQAIDKFMMEADSRILIATPGAAKEGLTLTVANHAVFYDRSFSLDDYLQAQDRIHRISQEKTCYIHNLIAGDTIDEWVDRLLYTKNIAAQIAQGDISKGDGSELFDIDLSEMLSDVLQTKKENRE